MSAGRRGRVALALAALAVVFGLITAAATAHAGSRFITIGTGGVTGVYYPTGGAICRFVNRDRDRHGMRCSTESTPGSIFNLNAMRNGDLDFAIVQTDWLNAARTGSEVFADAQPHEELRTIFSLHPEAFTVVARADSDITQFSDLPGKRVNVGVPGSGQRANMQALMDLLGWGPDTFRVAAELRPAAMPRSLCDGNLDAFVYMVGHPSGAITEAAVTCDVRLIEVSGAEVDDLITGQPFYERTTIPGGMYRGNPDDVETFSVGAALVASSEMEADTVYELVRGVFDNFERFRSTHPSLGRLERRDMLPDEHLAPLHEGARRYFEEVGMIPGND